MMDIEGHTIVYLRDLLNTRAIKDTEIADFLPNWLYQESYHGRALERLLGQLHGGAKHDYVTSWGKTLETQPNRYALVDFNYRKPRPPWDGDGLIDQENALAKFSMIDYPGGEFDDAVEEDDSKKDWLGQDAKARIEELHMRYETFSGGGNERRCAPGMILTLTEHEREHYNADYLITAVSYSASAGAA